MELSRTGNKKPIYDISTKPYEIATIKYMFCAVTRKLKYCTEWKHYRYYNTLYGGQQALERVRKFGRMDYPPKSIKEMYPDTKPTIYIYRYKLVKREIIKINYIDKLLWKINIRRKI